MAAIDGFLLAELQQKFPEYKTYIVGGAVRDMIMGLECHDVDFATNIPMELLEKEYKTVDIGKNKDFGILVIQFEGSTYEIAQFRKDGKYSDSRHPDSIEFAGTIEEDLARRDFTINAMAWDGKEIIDPFGGQEDLEKGYIRFVGNAQDRIDEDPLRILRAYRFAARFKFRIINESCMTGNTLLGVSQERITDELRKVAGYSGKALAFFIDRTKRNQIDILPELKGLNNYNENFPHNIENHPEGDVYSHIIHCLSCVNKGEYLFNLAVLFHDIGKFKTLKFRTTKEGKSSPTYYGHDTVGAEYMEEIGARLKLGSKEIETIQYICKYHMLRWDLPKVNNRLFFEILEHPDYEWLAGVCLTDEMSRLYMSDYDHWYDTFTTIQSLYEERKGDRDIKQTIKDLVDGEKIIQLTGRSGKDVGYIKRMVTNWIYEKEFKVTQEEVDSFILSLSIND